MLQHTSIVVLRFRTCESFEQAEPQVQAVPAIVRADSNGSLESLCDAIEQLPQDEVKVQVVRKDVGSLSEADIEYSKDTGALLFTFNVKVPSSLERKADSTLCLSKIIS